MFEPRNIKEGHRLSAGQRLVVFIMNVLLLVELGWAMYLGQQNPENLTAIFLRTFVPLAAGTVAAARILLRRLPSARSGSTDNSA